MSNSERNIYDRDESISLASVLKTVWQHRFKILITSSITLLLAVLYLFIATPKYTATMIVAAVEGQDNSSALGALSQLSSMAGISIGESDSGMRFNTFVDLLLSHVVAKRLMDDELLVRKIFLDEWDQDNNRWRPAPGIVGFLKRLPDMLFGRSSWSPPSPARLAEYLSNNVNIHDFGDTGMKKISFSHRDSAFSVELLQKIYAAADEDLKADALIRTKQYIAYLEKRLAAVSVAEHRQALSELLVDQERNQMIIEADLPFAARMVGDIMASDLPDKPKVLATLIVMLLIGVFAGTLWIFLLQKEGGVPEGHH